MNILGLRIFTLNDDSPNIYTTNHSTNAAHQQAKGLCKVKKLKKIPNKSSPHPPTHPPTPIQTGFVGNPSLTWTEHSIIITNNV